MTTDNRNLSGPFLSRDWMGSTDANNDNDWVMVGIPYDGTCSYRPGTRFAPEAIRLASWGLETYSPIQDKDLENVNYIDAGDLELPFGNRDKSLQIIESNARDVLKQNKRWFGIGGEHLVTWPVIKAYVEKYPDLAILHFDAHADLRDDYLGEELSHATVLRRCVNALKPNSLVQIGIRSGPEEEWQWMRDNDTIATDITDIQRYKERLGNRPVFITVDLDVLDPSVLPGTGTPEPGGLTFNEWHEWLLAFKGLNVVGADVVELSPHYDTSGVSTAVATKVIRELLLFSN